MIKFANFSEISLQAGQDIIIKSLSGVNYNSNYMTYIKQAGDHFEISIYVEPEESEDLDRFQASALSAKFRLLNSLKRNRRYNDIKIKVDTLGIHIKTAKYLDLPVSYTLNRIFNSKFIEDLEGWGIIERQ